MKSVALLITFLAVLCNVSSAQFADTTVHVYADFADSLVIPVPKAYVNAFVLKYGFNWKDVVRSKLVDIAKEAKEEYDLYQGNVLQVGISSVETIEQLNSLISDSKAYKKTILKTDIATRESEGYIITE